VHERLEAIAWGRRIAPLGMLCPSIRPELAYAVDALLQTDRESRPANASRAAELVARAADLERGRVELAERVLWSRGPGLAKASSLATHRGRASRAGE
jgi:hypothetical protein